MKKLFFSILYLLLIKSNSQTISWANHGKGPQNTYGDGIANDNNGNVYITGDFRDSIRFGNLKITGSISTPYAAKFDSLGNPIWLIPNVGGDEIVFDGASNLYTANQNNQTIQKLDLSGNLIWSKQTFTSTVNGSNGVNGLYATPNFVYLSGHFSGDGRFDNDTVYNYASGSFNWDAFVAKFNATTGVNVWAKRFGGRGSDKGYDVKVLTNGDIYHVGFYRDTAVVNTTSFITKGGADCFVNKLDLNGNYIWTKTFGGIGLDLAKSLTLDQSGNAYVMGRFDSQMAVNTTTINGASVNSYVTKFDGNGNLQWIKALAGNEEGGLSYKNNKLAFIISSSNGLNIGNPTLTQIGGTDIVLGEMDAAGNILWSKIYGGIGNEEGSAVTQHNGSLYFTGSFNTTATFDAFTFTSMQSYDAVVGRISGSASTNIIKHVKNSELRLYPNPAHNKLFIALNVEVSKPYTVKVIDVMGKVIFEDKKNQNETVLNLENLHSGIYFITITAEGEKYTAKFVKN